MAFSTIIRRAIPLANRAIRARMNYHFDPTQELCGRTFGPTLQVSSSTRSYMQWVDQETGIVHDCTSYQYYKLYPRPRRTIYCEEDLGWCPSEIEDYQEELTTTPTRDYSDDEIKAKVHAKFNEIGDMIKRKEIGPEEGYRLLEKFYDDVTSSELEFDEMMEADQLLLDEMTSVPNKEQTDT